MSNATTKRGVLHRSKNCVRCGTKFYYADAPYNWERRRYCGKPCSEAASRFTPEQREAAFWEKVDKLGLCWLWTAGKDIWGYGRFNVGGKLVAAHRFSYELANGPIPAGLLVLHSCDTQACVNPAHLRLGTDAENTTDKLTRGRGRNITHPKLTEKQVLEIRSLYWCMRAGKRVVASNAVELSQRYGVQRSTITNAARKETWKHL